MATVNLEFALGTGLSVNNDHVLRQVIIPWALSITGSHHGSLHGMVDMHLLHIII